MIAAGQYFLPVWMQLLIGLSAFLVAAGIIWKKLIQPAAKLITLLDDALPLLKDLAEHFKDTPHIFPILKDIADQFRTNSGTTLRDVVNRLEKAAEENKITGQVLTVNLEAQRKLAEQDRAQVARLVVLLDTVSAKQHESLKTVNRLEAGANVVASDLSAAHERADKVQDGEAGAAADAAARKSEQ